jgi:hypothetical protein
VYPKAGVYKPHLGIARPAVFMHDMQRAGRVTQWDTALFLCVLPS